MGTDAGRLLISPLWLKDEIQIIYRASSIMSGSFKKEKELIWKLVDAWSVALLCLRIKCQV